MTKISDQNSSKYLKGDCFSEVAVHQLVSLLKIDSLASIFEDFACLLEATISGNTF